MIDLTIIVPHYNSQDSLERLLLSIPVENGRFQVIVVDDNSASEKYNLYYLKSKFKKVTFLKNNSENKGAGACRNIGIEQALGKWVLFADSDDFFTDLAFTKLQDYYSAHYDVIFFVPTSIEYPSKDISNRHIGYKALIDKYMENKSTLNELNLRYKFSVPWSKLIKTSFIKSNNLLFDEVLASNDIMFSAKVGDLMENFLVLPDVIYCVTKNKGSLTTLTNKEIFICRLNVFIRYVLFLRTKLSNVELNEMDINGKNYLIKSFEYKLGILLPICTFLKLRKYHIKMFDKRFLYPNFLFRKLISQYKISKENKKFYIKQ